MKQKSLGVKARKRIGSVVYHFFTFPYYYANGFSVGYGRLLGWL